LSTNSEWYKAQTLSERLLALHHNLDSECFYDDKKANIRYLSWIAIAAFKGDDLGRFNRRLELEKCSKKEFLQILGIPPDKIFPNNSIPYWLQEIFDSEGELTESPFGSKVLEEYSDRGIICIFIPLVNRYINNLVVEANKIPGLQNIYSDSDKLIDLFLNSFLQTFEQAVRRAVVLEINSLRILGRLEGNTPNDRFKDFVKKTKNRAYRLGFLKKYPVLARYAQRSLEIWVDSSIIFLTQLTNDWPRIKTGFNLNSIDQLTSFRTSGDTHNRGRSVAVLTFESGKKILYKPRNLAIDDCFQNFLFWCNAAAATDFRLMKIITFEDHGWVEYIENESVKNEQEYNRFYVRLGSLIAILYTIEAVDIHFENLVALGEQPVVVDLETLFHNELSPRRIHSASDAVRHLIDTSIMSIGILPRPILSDNGRKTFDISGIAASINQQAPYNVIGIDNFGRDDIRIMNIPGWIPSVHNRPDDSQVRAIPADKILDGFCSMYGFLMENKDLLISDEGPLNQFKKCDRRLIVRDTKRYGGLQMDELHPDLLRDDLDRTWHWDNLWTDTIKRPLVENFIKSEQNQIQINDIPHFTVKVDGNLVTGADGTIIQGLNLTSGWEAAKSRIQTLSTQDMRNQSWFIRAALGATDSLNSKPLSAASADDFLLGACEIGDEILDNLIWHKNSASFLKVISIVGENKSSSDAFSIDDADQGIYEGRGGVILFLAYLGRESKKVKYLEAAKALLITIKNQRDISGVNSISGFLGNGSLVYLYTHLSILWSDISLLEEAEEYIELIIPGISGDRTLDLLTGAAGCILSVLPLAAINPLSKATETAIQCAEHLLEKMENGQPRWTGLSYKLGLSHGLSGVGMAIHQLGYFIGNKRYQEESLNIVSYENTLIQEGRWTDSHQLNGRSQVSWCHGAPGIALGRLSMYRNCSSLSLKNDIKLALKETISHYKIPSHCLCHGTLGNLEPLLVAELYSEFDNHTNKVRDSFAEVLQELIASGWRSLLPNQTLSLGLMTGLSGVGYSLLRFHNRDRVPSVLMMEPPPIMNRTNHEKNTGSAILK
jgi:type 2 lantibiotic biosynthesis protein LanM